MGIAELEPPSHGGLCGFVNSGGPGNIWSTTLDCGSRGAGTIDSVVFADYGLPKGFCNALQAGSCTKDVKAAVAAACVGKAACTLLSSDATFGAAPCGGNRLAVEVTCSNKAVSTFTYWNFDIPDQGMQDFLTSGNSDERFTIPNFSTIPNWLFTNPDRSYFPDDPLGETWGYESGRAFRDPTLKDLGDYYGRLVAHFVEGGFEDEAGNFIPGHNWTIVRMRRNRNAFARMGTCFFFAHKSHPTCPSHATTYATFRSLIGRCSTRSRASTACRPSCTPRCTTQSCPASGAGRPPAAPT